MLLRRAKIALLLAGVLQAEHAAAVDRLVSTTTELNVALAAAQPGDLISLTPGVYGGAQFRVGLSDVVIRRAPGTAGEAIVRGGIAGIQLVDATNVTIEGLTFEQQTGNGLNIDDGGTFDTPSTNITIRDVTVRDMAGGGNLDGIKLSGVTGFLIERVRVFDWGAGGSAVDPVGSHHGVVRNSHFRSDVLSDVGSAVRPKGGSKDIVVHSNLIELPAGSGCAFQAGGSTGADFFRFIDGDSGYEADTIAFYGNRTTGGSSAASWVNIDGGVFRYNDFRSPGRWAMRILNENQGGPIIDTQNGAFSDNYIAYDSTWSRAVNVGAETVPDSYSFTGNRWWNASDPTPAGSTPSLPTPETDGQYGVAAPWGEAKAMQWSLTWGEWIVTLDAGGQVVPIDAFRERLLARPLEGARFDPTAADPLAGEWELAPAPASITTAPFTDAIIIRPDACSLCSTIAGDYDRDGAVTLSDGSLWAESYGYAGAAPLADGNGDGLVDAADYTIWRDALAASQSTAVPEPPTIAALLLGLACLTRNRPEG